MNWSEKAVHQLSTYMTANTLIKDVGSVSYPL